MSSCTVIIPSMGMLPEFETTYVYVITSPTSENLSLSADFSILEHVVIAKRTSTVIDGSDGSSTNEDLTNPQDTNEEEAE